MSSLIISKLYVGDLLAMCKEYYKRICDIESAKYDIEKEVEFKDYKVTQNHGFLLCLWKFAIHIGLNFVLASIVLNQLISNILVLNFICSRPMWSYFSMVGYLFLSPPIHKILSHFHVHWNALLWNVLDTSFYFFGLAQLKNYFPPFFPLFYISRVYMENWHAKIG